MSVLEQTLFLTPEDVEGRPRRRPLRRPRVRVAGRTHRVRPEVGGVDVLETDGRKRPRPLAHTHAPIVLAPTLGPETGHRLA